MVFSLVLTGCCNACVKFMMMVAGQCHHQQGEGNRQWTDTQTTGNGSHCAACPSHSPRPHLPLLRDSKGPLGADDARANGQGRMRRASPCHLPHHAPSLWGHSDLAAAVNPTLSSGWALVHGPCCFQVPATVPSSPRSSALAIAPSLEIRHTCPHLCKDEKAHEHRKRCSRALVMRKMQIKTTMAYHLVCNRSAIIIT